MNPLWQQNQDIGNDDRLWVQVTETFGASQTGMIIEYLRAHGIHAVAVGSKALGMITGANSVARVMVPEEDVGQAMNLLEPDNEIDTDGDRADETEATSSISDTSKVVLGATVIAFNPLGAGIAYAISRIVRSEDEKTVNYLVDCPKCGIGLELTKDEIVQRWFICPECDRETQLDNLAVCPSCQSELELDADEQTRGWYICPECRRAVHI